MAVLRFFATAGACAAAALAIGQFMQTGVSRASATPVALPETYPEAPMMIGPMPETAPPAAIAFDRPVQMRAPAPLTRLPVPEARTACDLSFSAEARAGAMAALRLDAPCAPEARVVLRHQGLSVTLLSDAQGRAEALFPALAERAVFMAEAGGETAIASVDLPDMAEWQRVALQWRESDGVSLHALAPGGKPGGAGDLGLATPGTAGATGARVTALGHAAAPAARLAQVYSAPVEEARSLRVEIEVTERNCGAPVLAEMVRSDGVGGLSSLDFEVTLPGCEALGELLVLQNLGAELTLAAR
ncbi:hypothetical protein [Limimaricola litoreus]|uniref:Translocase n=1 Tax=Limimaricola litoreus TaxID=2955316 RepID=A0A9X2FQ08_9RHOB|nr:hypothetical protein [Limimaricola litoreus]MCP1167830.1 hypothetical protein [Limimaricola litoreus]